MRTAGRARLACDLFPGGAREGLLAPMQRGAHLTGVLALDYGECSHRFTLEEEALAGAVAKLVILGMEHERFLREMAEAGARRPLTSDTLRDGRASSVLALPAAHASALFPLSQIESGPGERPAKGASWCQRPAQ